MKDIYPWEGDYHRGRDDSSIAVVTLNEKLSFDEEKVAIWGKMKTENLGIEKVIANVISNPYIRYIIVCGNEIRGHKSGRSLLALYENGIDEKGRIKDSPGAVPYIENIDEKAVKRFREQVEMIDMIGTVDKVNIEKKIDSTLKEKIEPFGEPYIAIKIKKKKESKFEADMALHSNLKVSPWGDIENMEEK